MRIFEESKSVFNEKISIYQTKIEKRMNVVEKWMNKQIKGTFVWAIDKISERRANDEVILSKYFYAMMHPYKMALGMRTNGSGDMVGTGLTIWLCIYPDVRNEGLSWPFAADITITIKNPATPDACKIVTKYCTIKKPTTTSWEWSDSFKFLYSDLSDASLLVRNFLMVECHGDPK